MKIYYYISKIFVKKFINVFLSFFVLLLLINLFDAFDSIKNVKLLNWIDAFFIAGLQTPNLIESIFIFIIFLSSAITLNNLSSNNEIIIIRSVGLSLWKIMIPIVAISFFIGILMIFLFNPISITATKKFYEIEQKINNIGDDRIMLFNKDKKNILFSKNGIWLNHKLDNNTSIIASSKRVYIYKSKLMFFDADLWFFNELGEFKERMVAKNMTIKNSKIVLKNISSVDSEFNNKNLKKIEIYTRINRELILNKIINNFENIRLFSIYELFHIMKAKDLSSFSFTKYQAYYYSLVTKPLLFSIISMLALVFTSFSSRSKHKGLLNIFGIAICLMLYVILAIITSLGLSLMLSPFFSSWAVVSIIFSITVILVDKKSNAIGR